MSIRIQNEVEALRRELDAAKLELVALRSSVDELTALLQAMTRASTARGKAA